MAKAKSGGTRSYLRGRVGADVYSIGKDGNGKKQQIVRSLAETVANPRTQAQMVNRMVMSTVMQAVSGLSQLIDHSFDGVANGQPSISEFIRRNYALVKDSVNLSAESGSGFGLVKYGEKGAHAGAYVVSQGDEILPSAVSSGQDALYFTPSGSGETRTFGDLIDALGISAQEYITYVRITLGNGVEFFRVFVNETDRTKTLTQENLQTGLTIVGNVNPTISVESEGFVTLKISQIPSVGGVAQGAIISKSTNKGWKHNTCVLTASSDLGYGAAVALPTYPAGEERFLNGGEL